MVTRPNDEWQRKVDEEAAEVLALNKINEQHVRAGLMGYETGEREELCDYITESLRRFGIDVKGLEQRNGADPGDTAGLWRRW